MSDNELKDIESLLLKLKDYVGSPVIVIPGYLHDGVHLAVYDHSGNAPVFTVTATDLKTCLDRYFNSLSA